MQNIPPFEKLRSYLLKEIQYRNKPTLMGPFFNFYRQSGNYPTPSLILLLSVYDVHGCIMLADGNGMGEPLATVP
jgi:hypothetical protein